MNYKKLIVLLGVFLAANSVLAENTAFDVYSEGLQSVQRKAEKEEAGFVVTKQQITPNLGMMPIFSESVIDDKELIQEILSVTSYLSEEKSDIDNAVFDSKEEFSVHSFFEQYNDNNVEPEEDYIDIAPEGTAEILIFERIKTYSELRLLEEKLEHEQKNGKVISEEKYMKVVEKLQQTDEKIFAEVEKKAGNFIDRFINFIGKKAKKGDILALTATISGIREFIEGKIDSQSDKKLELFVLFLKKVERTGLLIAQLMEEDNTFKKYYLLYLTINNIFINEYEPLFEQTEIVSGTEEISQQTGTISVSVVTEDNDSDSVVQDFDDNSTQTNINTDDMSLSDEIRFERLIENFEFEQYNTITQQEIQSFLERKGSCLKNPYRGTYPSQIIYKVCEQYNINPKLMLATFQKEQSLISKRTVSESTLDWALGVGCYDNGTKNSNYKGFERQIASAARIYRHWFDDGKNINVTKNGYRMKVNYGTTYQYMENEASYSLYRYTPHTVDIHLNVRGGGNYLFGKIYIGYWGGFLR